MTADSSVAERHRAPATGQRENGEHAVHAHGRGASPKRQDMMEVGGSIPSPSTASRRTVSYTADTRIGFRVERIGMPECPYLKRWVLQLGLFSIRLHQWRGSDDDRCLHDHPWWFLTVVLRGGYTDVTATGEDHLRIGSIRFRPSNHAHTVQVDPGGAWTLVITGRKSRDWGFFTPEGWLRQRKYFRRYGHHPCDD